MKRILRHGLMTMAALVWLPALGFAQEAVISGTVANTTGGVLPGVVVHAVLEASGNNFSAAPDGPRAIAALFTPTSSRRRSRACGP